jgi:hypothetical protein
MLSKTLFLEGIVLRRNFFGEIIIYKAFQILKWLRNIMRIQNVGNKCGVDD